MNLLQNSELFIFNNFTYYPTNSNFEIATKNNLKSLVLFIFVNIFVANTAYSIILIPFSCRFPVLYYLSIV